MDVSDSTEGRRGGGGEVDRELEAAKAEALEDLAEAEKTPEERAVEREKARQKLEQRRENTREQAQDRGQGDGFER